MFRIIGMIGIYCLTTFFMGGVTVGILFPTDAPIDHKVAMAISGNLWFFAITFLIIFLA